MVDALHEAHRVIAPRGLLVDSRPDSRVLARVDQGGRRVGTIATQLHELRDDAAADAAIARVKRERLFRGVRAGRFWNRIAFDDVTALRAYLADHLRLRHAVTWTSRPDRAAPISIVRAIRFELLARR